jgi:hydrogenase maturation protease
VGRVAVERLLGEDLGRDVVVEELHYGAIAVMQRLEDLRPDALVLVGAAERGRTPGTVERRRLEDPRLTREEVQTAVSGAITGYINIDLVVDVASGFGALPARSVAIEIEPVSTEPSTALTPEVEAALEQVLDLVRDELRRLPVLGLADQLRELVADERLASSPALGVLRR